MSSASARVDELLKRYEENPRRFFAPLANEYRKSGNLDAAIDLCRMHLEEQPGHLSGHIVYGQALYEAGRAADAKTAFEAALQLDPENLIALRHVGDIARAHDDLATARHWYQRVLEADPRNDDVIALIASLDTPPAPHVVVAEQTPPPPPPSYAVDRLDAVPALETGIIAPSAPAPAIAMEAVAPATPPATPPAHPIIGLMDLDLDLGEESTAAGTLLDVTPPADDAPAVDPAAGFHADFSLTDFGVPTGAEPATPEPAATNDLDVLADQGIGAGVLFDVGSAGAPDTTFGNALTADEQIGEGDVTPAPTADPGFMADSFLGRELTDESLDAASDLGTTPPPFVTETMAELYLQQGFRDEALAVYRQLLEQNPGDRGLEERITHLEHDTRSSMAPDRVSEDSETAIADETRWTAEIPVVPSEPSAVVPSPPVAELPEPVPAPTADAYFVETTPAFLVQPPAETSAVVPAVPRTPAAPVGPTVRDVLARIAARRVVTVRAAAEALHQMPTSPSPLPAVDPSWGVVPGRDAPADLEGTPAAVAAGGSIDALFGVRGVSRDDEGAAATMASAFAADPEPEPGIRGQPTYRGDDELSLNSVFGADAPRTAPHVQRQSSNLRFDQFFAGAEEPPAALPAPASSPEGTADEDVAQFTDWLKGLKQS